MNILLLFGGVSSEHEVSIKSAQSISNVIGNMKKYTVYSVYITKDGLWKLVDNSLKDLNIENSKTAILSPEKKSELIIYNNDSIEKIKIDVAFPVLHGKNGEDGTIQGLFEISGVKYVGCGVSASANSMDKSITKILVDTKNIPQSPCVLVKEIDYYKNKKIDLEELEFPMFVKPCSSGSSVGVSKVSNMEELTKAVENAFIYDSKVLIEKNISGREVEVAVLGNTNLSRNQHENETVEIKEILTSYVGEIEPAQEFYSFDAKYKDDNSKLYIPARIALHTIKAIQDYAIDIYKVLDCNGLSRVDFFVTEDEEGNESIIFNEINTLPGFTNISMYPKLFNQMGISYEELVEKLINLAIEN